MTTQRLSDEAAKRFYRGRKKLVKLKKTLGYNNDDLQIKSGLTKSAVMAVFAERNPTATVVRQSNLDTIICAIHLNPGWVYGKSKKMFIDYSALTHIDFFMLMTDTRKKREAMVERLKVVMETDALTYDELADLGGLKKPVVSQWINRAQKSRNFVDLLLKYCKKYKVNPKWLFGGTGHPRIEDWVLIDDDEVIRRKAKKRKKKWYIVNRTVLVTNHGWWIDPKGFQIKQGYCKKDVSKDYPSEYVWKNGRTEMKVITERPIASFRAKDEAELGLNLELRRIKEEGDDAWKAEWSREVIK